MSRFTGEFECKVDAKGRLVLPVRVKNRLPEAAANQVVLMRGMEPCLTLYAVPEFKKTSSQVASLNEFNEADRKIQRNFFSRVAEIDLDSAGRLNIPKLMLKHASIEKEVVIVGLGSRLEIWNPEVYEQYLIKDDGEFSNLVQKHLNE